MIKEFLENANAFYQERNPEHISLSACRELKRNGLRLKYSRGKKTHEKFLDFLNYRASDYEFDRNEIDNIAGASLKTTAIRAAIIISCLFLFGIVFFVVFSSRVSDIRNTFEEFIKEENARWVLIIFISLFLIEILKLIVRRISRLISYLADMKRLRAGDYSAYTVPVERKMIYERYSSSSSRSKKKSVRFIQCGGTAFEMIPRTYDFSSFAVGENAVFVVFRNKRVRVYSEDTLKTGKARII